MESTRPADTASLSLNSLSNELILMILRNFCLHCRQGPHPPPHAYFPSTGQQRHELSWYYRDIFTLHSMSLVSRRFSPLAQEILYHEFIPGYSDSLDSLGGCDWDWRFALFLRTVALNPCRAASVRRVHVNFSLFRCEPEIFTLAEEALKEAARARGVDIDEFRGRFRDITAVSTLGRHYPRYRFVGDELLGMLLACLPNLNILSLMASVPSEGIPASALRAGLKSPQIETLDLRCCCSSDSESLGSILELASSPLRNLYINMLDGDGLRTLTRHGPFPNLRNVCIYDSRLSRDGSELGSFLSSCASLETFSYHSIAFPDDDFLFTDAVRHLLRHKETLRTLHLDVERRPRTPEDKMVFLFRLLASLNRFPVLHNLLLNSEQLYDPAGHPAEDGSVLTRLLPPSIARCKW